MGFFDDQVAREKISNLEKDFDILKETLGRVQALQNSFQSQILEAAKRSPDYEEEARQASENAKTLSLSAQEALSEINAVNKKLVEFKDEIEKSQENAQTSLEGLQQDIKDAEVILTDLEGKNSQVSEGITATKEKIENFEKIFQNHPELEEEISDFEETILKIKDSEAKSNQLVKSITTRVIELETLYNQILGFTEKDENDEERIVKGLKQELESAFDGLDAKRSSLETEFQKLESTTKDNFTNFSKDHNQKSENFLSSWESKYTTLNKKIEGLLPNALTAGLSYAFSEKKAEEIKSHDSYKSSFKSTIWGLSAVSMIPIAISIYSISTDVPLEVAINRIPKIVIAILPLYIPVLWFAISTSKKMNLSKRLIEEYTHKEVLSKTYEGLAKQIENLEGDDSASDLKINLLQNFLLMYSENPGKLISDYNKTDHPIMELLENSNKLETTVQKLENIPGLSKIYKFLEKKSKKKVDEIAEKVEKGIDKVLASNDQEQSESDESKAEIS